MEERVWGEGERERDKDSFVAIRITYVRICV